MDLIPESIGEEKNMDTNHLLFGLDFSDFFQNIFYLPKISFGRVSDIQKNLKNITISNLDGGEYTHHLDSKTVKVLNIYFIYVCV